MALQKVAVPVPGPKPVGDPDVMDAMASACQLAGPKIVAGCNHATDAVTTMIFNSPKATAIRSAVGRHSHSATDLGMDLQDFAKALKAAAEKLRAELQHWGDVVEAAQAANNWNALVDANPNPLNAPDLASL